MALTNKLTSIGNAIRSKTGKNGLLTLDQMPEEIESIETGGDLPEEALTITGDCSYRFTRNGWNWFIDNYGDRINTSNITNSNAMFLNSSFLVEIPFTLNCKSNTSINFTQLFCGCNKLENIPQIVNAKPANTIELFSQCHSLREIDNEMFRTWDFSEMLNSTKTCYRYYMFSSCYSLREVPMNLINNMTSGSTGNTTWYTYYGFTHCWHLNELLNLPLPTIATVSTASSMFNSTINACYMLKNFTFATNNGTPKTAKFKAAILDFSNSTGYRGASYSTDMAYKSGVTLSDNIFTSDSMTIEQAKTRYNSMKNSPDWYACASNIVTYDGASRNIALLFGKYNHDSAVATINSLPDTSAYGTNIIKFKNYEGACTDGGGINDLTEAEIAVAAAKGWTVTIVN